MAAAFRRHLIFALNVSTAAFTDHCKAYPLLCSRLVGVSNRAEHPTFSLHVEYLLVITGVYIYKLLVVTRWLKAAAMHVMQASYKAPFMNSVMRDKKRGKSRLKIEHDVDSKYTENGLNAA